MLKASGIGALCCVLTSCLDPTQITLSISTNAKCTPDGFGTNVYVGADQAVTATTDRCVTVDDVHNTIGTVVVVPGSSGNRAEIRVVGTLKPVATSADRCGEVFSKAAADLTATDKTDLAHCILERRSVGFIPHTMLNLPVWLDEACAGVLCSDTQTCVSGNCVDDTVDCSSSGTCGDLDGGAPPPDAAPVPATPVSIAANGNATCVVTSRGRVQCWGANDGGKMGIATTPVPMPTDVGMSGVQRLSLGATHGCGFDTGGSVSCWGTNSHGEVDPGNSTVGPMTPVKVPVGATSSIAVGLAHSCAVVKEAGATKARCWGDGKSGQLGYGAATSPADVVLPYAPSVISAGANHTCALVGSNSEVFCWGGDTPYAGQSGPAAAGALINTSVPKAPIAGNTFVAAGANQSAAGSASQLFWWGDDTNGKLTGNGSGASSNPMATQSLIMKGAAMVAVGDNHVCGVTLEGSVKCWGHNLNQLGGTPSTDGSVLLAAPTGVKDIAAGSLHTCAIAPSAATVGQNGVWCWGDNHFNQLGPVNSTASLGAVEVPLAPDL